MLDCLLMKLTMRIYYDYYDASKLGLIQVFLATIPPLRNVDFSLNNFIISLLK